MSELSADGSVVAGTSLSLDGVCEAWRIDWDPARILSEGDANEVQERLPLWSPILLALAIAAFGVWRKI